MEQQATAAPSNSTSSSEPARDIVVIGGGTATNSLVDIFEALRESRAGKLNYVIPISDNGGSSSELIRVLGGPGIGDIRSRLVRLIPEPEGEDVDSADLGATKALFNHRLSSSPTEARKEWLKIVEGQHALWTGMSSDKRELIRSFFNLVNLEIVKRVRPSSTFDFGRAAIGNLFLTGGRLFSGSLDSAIFLLSRICHIPLHSSVLPAINTNFTHHISASLVNGVIITGQNNISHPSAPTALPDTSVSLPASTYPSGPASATPSASQTPSLSPVGYSELEAHDLIEDATLPGSLPTLRKSVIHFSKSGEGEEDLEARIDRLWYINPYGHEVTHRANPKIIAALQSAQVVVYSIGSLYTSLASSLILKGVGAAIAAPVPGVLKKKVLILNATNDRETGPSAHPFTATDFVKTIVRACEQSRAGPSATAAVPPVLNVRRYVTHLIHLKAQGGLAVNREQLAEMGVLSIPVFGRRLDGIMTYDEGGLAKALHAVVGNRTNNAGRKTTDL